MLRRLVPAWALWMVSVLFCAVLVAAARTPEQRPPAALIPVIDGSPVHDVGNVRVHASNWGAFGSKPGSGAPFSSAPSTEWPAGSGVEYVFEGGLWVGALLDGVVPVVSTSSYAYEFRPSSDLSDIVYRTASGATGGNRIPAASPDDDADGVRDEDWLNGHDDDGDGAVDEDFAAISDQMFARRFRDDDPAAISAYPQHQPMNLLVREESYQWADDDYDDFVGFTFRITNDGTHTLQQVYVGVFADGDVGHRSTPDYWADDATAFQNDVIVDHGPHGSQSYDFAYWYDVDGDVGQAPGYCGIVVLDHPVDPTGVTAPEEVGVVTYATFSGNASYEDGGDPTNDFERYELMSSKNIERDPAVPRDQRTLLAVGPFAAIAPGETMEFSFALVVTPRDDFTHVERAAIAHHGQWFDLDGDPGTGINGREHQEHWYLPGENPVPVAITSFDARAADEAVRLEWRTWADEEIAGYELLRATGTGAPARLADAIPADRHEYLDENVEPGTRYQYQLIAHGVSGWTTVSQRVEVTVPPLTLALHPNVPNPFIGSTSIGFTVPERARVTLAVFDAAGRRVATIASAEVPAGTHEVAWNGTDDAGRRVSAGVYFCRLEAGKRTIARKLLLLE